MQYSPIQAFTARFVSFMQLYHPRRKTAHRALQRLFLRFAPFNRPQYQTGKSGYNAACATLEHITAPQHLQRIPKYKRHARTLYRSAQPPYYNKVCKGSASPPVQGQPGGGLDTSHARRFAVWHPPPGGAVQRQERGGRRGILDGYRRISFRAFAR